MTGAVFAVVLPMAMVAVAALAAMSLASGRWDRLLREWPIRLGARRAIRTAQRLNRTAAKEHTP